MVMSKQPDGMRRVKRAAGADGKTSEYTIYFTPTGGAEAEVGYSKRVIKGSVSKWEGYLRTGEGTYQVFPDEYRDHNALMTDLRDKFLESPLASAQPAAETAEKAPKTTKAKASKSTKAKAATAEVPTPAAASDAEAPPAATSADQAEQPVPVVVVPGQEPEPAHLHAGGHDVVIPPANAEAQAAVAAADEEPVEVVPDEDAAGDGEVEVVVVTDEQGNVEAVAVVEGELQGDGTVAPPASVPSVFDPFADPLADPLSPAFLQQS